MFRLELDAPHSRNMIFHGTKRFKYFGNAIEGILDVIKFHFVLLYGTHLRQEIGIRFYNVNSLRDHHIFQYGIRVVNENYELLQLLLNI